MKVTMLVQISGTRDGKPWPNLGDVLTTSDAEGADLCSLGYAEAVAVAPKPERTTPKRAEKRG